MPTGETVDQLPDAPENVRPIAAPMELTGVVRVGAVAMVGSSPTGFEAVSIVEVEPTSLVAVTKSEM